MREPCRTGRPALEGTARRLHAAAAPHRLGPALLPLILAAGCAGDPTQPLPERAVPALDDPITSWPISQRFGRWNDGWGAFHLALDIDGEGGDPVVAVADGLVRVALVDVPGYGAVVVTEHPVGGRTATGSLLAIYGHMSTRSGFAVRVGESVDRGQRLGVLAYDDEDGGAWPPHLHLGLRAGPHSNGAGLCGVWLYVGYSRACDGVTHAQFMADGWIDPEVWFR